MADWVVFLAIVLTVLGAPFLGVMALARRLSGTQAPIVRQAVLAWVWFVLVSTLLSAIWRWAALSASYGPGMISAFAASLGAAWSVWRLTHRYTLSAMVPVLSASTVPLFFAIEDLTHGPFYIRSEGLAILVSIGVTALLWHMGITGMLLAWAKLRGRREAWARQGRCRACGYDLKGAPTAICPECDTTSAKTTR